jgi:PAS domain S-box-containing protein
MNQAHVAQQITALHRRVQTLFSSAAATQQDLELLPVAFEELANALEQLRAMQEELRVQQEELLNTRELVEAELQSYKDHFLQAPVAYLLTNMNGTIRLANYAAAELFSRAEKFLVGRSLALFVPEGERRAFRERLTQLAHSRQPQSLEARMQSWKGMPFQAVLTAAVAHGPLGHPTTIRWIVQTSTARAPAGEQRSTHVAEPVEQERMVGGCE